MCLSVCVCTVYVCECLCKYLVFKIYFVTVCQHTNLYLPSFHYTINTTLQMVSITEHVDPITYIMCYNL